MKYHLDGQPVTRDFLKGMDNFGDLTTFEADAQTYGKRVAIIALGVLVITSEQETTT